MTIHKKHPCNPNHAGIYFPFLWSSADKETKLKQMKAHTVSTLNATHGRFYEVIYSLKE